MSKAPVQYKVFQGEGEGAAKPEFYFHMILGNGEIVAPSQGYKVVRNVFKSVDSIWLAHWRAQNPTAYAEAITQYGTPAKAREWFLKWNPPPYTKDSLKPMPRH